MSEQGGGEFFLGFLIGAVAGAVAALLLTPYSGEDLRKQIGEKGSELGDRAGGLVDDARARVGQAAGDVRTQVSQTTERGRIVLAGSVRKAQQAVQDAQAHLAGGEADAG